MPFTVLTALATHLHEELQNKKFVLLYAYNGTGKTRLSTVFKDLGKSRGDRDTLYFNAFTEDLFSWDNDLANDRERAFHCLTPKLPSPASPGAYAKVATTSLRAWSVAASPQGCAILRTPTSPQWTLGRSTTMWAKARSCWSGERIHEDERHQRSKRS